MKAQVYKDPRPAEYFDRFHERARTASPTGSTRSCGSSRRLRLIVFRARAIAAENVPATGPVILAPNHFSFMDHFFARRLPARKVRFMAKSQLFKRPMQFIYTHGGVFPVRRGHRDEEAFITAEAMLERGGCVGCTARAAARARASSPSRSPASAGWRSSRAPRSSPSRSSVPRRSRNWKRLQFPKVTVQLRRPDRLRRVEDPTREQQQAVADQIFAEIKALYAELEAEGARGRRPARARGGPRRPPRPQERRCRLILRDGVLAGTAAVVFLAAQLGSAVRDSAAALPAAFFYREVDPAGAEVAFDGAAAMLVFETTRSRALRPCSTAPG